jgi:hypothetical protein
VAEPTIIQPRPAATSANGNGFALTWFAEIADELCAAMAACIGHGVIDQLARLHAAPAPVFSTVSLADDCEGSAVFVEVSMVSSTADVLFPHM